MVDDVGTVVGVQFVAVVCSRGTRKGDRVFEEATDSEKEEDVDEKNDDGWNEESQKSSFKSEETAGNIENKIPPL